MNPRATIAQGLWAVGNLKAAGDFATALRYPADAQRTWLMRRLAADADSRFGREHDFASIRDGRDFVRKVPLRDGDGFRPWIERIRAGETAVLGSEPVSHLAPTSGSSGARKLVPFTRTLHRSFAAAVGAWMGDLVSLEPGILAGSAYWSISPSGEEETHAPGQVRVGFADDAEYLGGWQARLARWAMAVPPELRHERDVDVFWLRTASSLLARSDLRLISIWHPSFLNQILQTIERDWCDLLPAMGKRRAAELERAGRGNPAGWWPALRVISCWGDLAAAPGLRDLAARFPACLVQAKGLLATEAVVTIPWRGSYPLAVGSHYFEFLTDEGELRLAHELERGKTYETIVTNGGGLWRYRLGDLVECTGHCARTPTLRFLGRAGNVSDLRGEKLSEAFVAETLASLWPDPASRPEVAYLRPVTGSAGTGYELVVSRAVGAGLPDAMDRMLRENPHYDLARRLGQLLPLEMRVDPESCLRNDSTEKRRLGDIKPRVLEACRGA